MSEIRITLPDGSERAYPEGATGADVATSIGSRLAKAAVATRVDGDEWDLGRPLHDGAHVSIITADTDAAGARGLIAVIDGCYQSASTGQRVAIPR